MKNRPRFITSLGALLLLVLAPAIHAEALRTFVRLTADSVVPPPATPPASLSVDVVVTIDVVRDGSGNPIASTPYFLIYLNTRELVEITSCTLREGAVNANGPIRIDLLSGGRYGDPPIPVEIITGGNSIDPALSQRILANPDSFYIDLRTFANPDGVLRGQLHKFTESQANTVTLNSLNEVPPVGTPASGTATVTIDPARNSNGIIVGGMVTFSVLYNLPANSEIIGLNLHKQVAGANGDPVISSGLSRSNSILTSTGRGSISLTVRVKSSEIETIKQLINDPASFYVNLQTKANENGLIRGQLASIAAAPVIHRSDTTFLQTDSVNPGRVELAVTEWDSINFDDFDRINGVLINGQATPYSSSVSGFVSHYAGHITVNIPPQMRAIRGTLFIQIRNSQGLLSTPFIIAVAPASQVNSIPAITVDAAKYGNLVAPEAIVSAFGTRLASRPVAATTLPLPTSLDDTTVYLNGVAAGLLYASGQQVNYIIPSGAGLGPADVVITAKDGTVSRGRVNVAASIPAIFTARGDGTGAPAGVASADGQNFNISLSNSDGTPVPIDAGNYVSLFGTGMRFSSTPLKITIGGREIEPLFFGPQGFYEGLDQVNLQIPQLLAGSGDVDLVLTLDGKSSNTAKLRIR